MNSGIMVRVSPQTLLSSRLPTETKEDLLLTLFLPTPLHRLENCTQSAVTINLVTDPMLTYVRLFFRTEALLVSAPRPTVLGLMLSIALPRIHRFSSYGYFEDADQGWLIGPGRKRLFMFPPP
jgi:hypothetical protein